MASNSLNQVVLTALQQVSGSSRSRSNTQGGVPDLLPLAAESYSSAVTEASRQINVLTSANLSLIETVLANTQAVTQNSSAQTSGKNFNRVLILVRERFRRRSMHERVHLPTTSTQAGSVRTGSLDPDQLRKFLIANAA